MWKWGSQENLSSKPVASGSRNAANMPVADLTEQLARTEQLVTQLKELIREKDTELLKKDHQLKEEKEASEAKLSKEKLHNRAKVTSLTSQLEELKKQLSGSGQQELKAEQKKASKDSDHENAAANRGKILVLKRRIEDLEAQVAQKNEELRNKTSELEAQYQRGAEMDAMLVEKEKKLHEKDAYIVDLHLACGGGDVTRVTLACNEELKNQLSAKESSLQNMQILVENLTKKVGDSEERCSLLQEQIKSLQNLQSKEKGHFQEREAMYIENIRMFQNIIQEKEKEFVIEAQKHEQELFKLAARSDASADLEQLLKALKQKLHEKEEVMLGRTQVIVMLQKELDDKDQQLKEINENLKLLQSEKNNLQSKLDAEKHVMKAQLKDMMEKHELEMKKSLEKHELELRAMQEKHNAEAREIQDRLETKLQEKDQSLMQLQKRVTELSNNGQSNSEQVIDIDAVIKERMEQLEGQVKLKTEEASKSEAKFLKTKAWSKSKIKQLEDELKSLSSKNNDISALNNHISDLEIEKEELQSKLQALSELRTQNEELQAKLEVYEEQQRKLQADLEQVTKRAASQASESGSVDELQSQLLEWQEIVPESEEARDQVREEKSAIALRMAQIEEEREGLIEDDWFFPGCSDPAIVSGQQELEEELTTGQGIGRLQQSRRKSNQASRKLQEEYSFDGKQCFQELNVTLDSTDSAEGENMGGLRTVVEELELERNQLQEQILFLEERCQDLEDRLQLQERMEGLQNENERLQTQLTQLRSQQMRDAEKHQGLISNLNEQLKGLSDKNSFLETSLVEKEQKLLSTKEKVEEIETLKRTLQDKDLLNKELSEKFGQIELKLDEALKKCSTYEVECTEQKIAINDLTEKVATFKEKTLKQDAAVELMQQDLDQTNEELDRLNTSHLEERSQLIHDLQRHEREIDNLKEVLVEKDKEISVLSSSMIEYSEQITILKCQIQSKEAELREVEEALSKANREIHLLKEVQTVDIRDTSMKISALSEQNNTMALELDKAKELNGAKTKENEELVRQVSESSIIIKDLRSEIKANNIAYHNKLMECESQITLLKEQMTKSSEKLQETEIKHKEETEYLKSQLEEKNSSKEKLNSLLKEKENKEQTLENELKSVKDVYNKLVLEAAKKDEELSKLSFQLTEYIEHQETLRKALQEKVNIITSLEQQLQVAQQQNEEAKLTLIEELKAKDMQSKELNNQLNEIQKIMNKMEIEALSITSANKQLQADLEGKEKDLAEQIQAKVDLRNAVEVMEKEKQQLISENESLSKLLDTKECELLMRTQAMAAMEDKLSVSTIEYQKTLSELSDVKETLTKKCKQLSIFAEQKENSLTEQVLEKTKEYNVLISQLREQIQLLTIQLNNAEDREMEKEGMLNGKLSECNMLVQKLSHSEEKILSLQKQIQNITLDFEGTSRSLEEKILQNASLLKQAEENNVDMARLEDEIQKLKDENMKLSERIEERDLTIKNQGVEVENFHRQIAEKIEESAKLNNQLEIFGKQVEILKYEKEDLAVACSRKSNDCDILQSQLLQHQSELVSIKNKAHELTLETEKLKVDLEIANETVIKKSDEIATLTSHLSQQGHNILALKDQIDSLIIEKETLKISLEEKEALLLRKEILIEEMGENKVAEGRYLQIISDLQIQMQVLSSETSQIKQAMQEKENECRRQAQELKLFKDKSEESGMLRVQLSENMEVLSNLQCQLKTMTEKSAELNESIVQKDKSLKQKVDEYVNLKAYVSEMKESSFKQQKQLEVLTCEVEQLKAIILEKELIVSNTTLLNEKLKIQLQDKEKECEVLKKQVTDLEEAKLKLKTEVNDQKRVINDTNQSLAEKESFLVENASLLKKLSDKAIEDDGKLKLLTQVQSQVHELMQELEKSRQQLQEKESIFISLQEKFTAVCEQRTELNITLSKKEENITGLLNSLNEKDASIQLAESNISALTKEIKLLQEKLEKSDTALKNIASVLQEKDENFAINQKKIDSLTVELFSIKTEHQKALDQINIFKQDAQQKELTLQNLQLNCTEQAKNVELLKSELNNINSKSSQDCHDHTLLIDSLQKQVTSLEREKVLRQVNAEKLVVENRELIACQSLLQQKLEKLQEINEKLEASENYFRMQIDAVKLQMKTEKEQLQMQVSSKGEEVSELKLKVGKLEQSVLESENKWVTELDREIQQNSVLNEKVRSLESEMKSKDGKIHFLQQELDLMKEELTKNLSALYSTRLFCKEQDANTPNANYQVTDSKIKWEKFSSMISTILSKEVEGEGLQLALLEKKKEIDILKKKLRHMQSLEETKVLLQNDLEKVKGTYQSEIERLSQELVAVKETAQKQQSLLEGREESFAELNKQINFLQNQIDKSKEELKTSSENLSADRKKIVSLLAEMEKKDHLIENLTSQTKQQKDLISALSQQLKEKDCSITQVMESLSNEMMKFSEERNLLNGKLQQLESVQNSSIQELNQVSQQLENYKKEVERNQVILSHKEAAFKDLMNEKEQMQFSLEKLGKEKENLKKKLQAALLVRKDLMQKIANIENNTQEEIEKEHKKTEELLKRIDALTQQMKLVQMQNRDLESHLETLKQQLLEKDAKINKMSETLSAEVSNLEHLQNYVAKLKDDIAVKEKESEQNLKSLEDKDTLLAHMQSVLNEKEKAYGEECCQFLLTLENLKAEILKKDELLNNINLVEPCLNAGVAKNSLGLNSEVNQLSQLEREREILRKKLQASLLAREEDVKKFQKEKEEHLKLGTDLSEQSNDLELLRKEHKTLQQVHQRKGEEFDCNQLLVCSPEKELEIHVAALQEKETTDPNGLESDEPKNKAQAVLEESQQTVGMTREETELEKLIDNQVKLQEETKMLKDEIRKTSFELDDKIEEMINLQDSVSQMEQPDKHHKGCMLDEINQLQKKLDAYDTEALHIKTTVECRDKEKEALLKRGEDYKASKEEIEELKINLQQANKLFVEKNKGIKELICILMDFKDKFDQEKGKLKETVQLQLRWQENQEESQYFKKEFEAIEREREELISNLGKANAELVDMKMELKHFSEENKKLMMELDILHEKSVPAPEERNMVSCKKDKENYSDDELVLAHSETDVLQPGLQGKDICVQSLQKDYSRRAKIVEERNCEIQKLTKMSQEQAGKNITVVDFALQKQKTVAQEQSREHLHRKLQAALISRKEALKENKCLKGRIDELMLEKEELTNKSRTLECLLSELGKEKQNSDASSSLSTEESLASENARLLTENENLTAACESLKSTMETIVQEKEAFSFQLNTLKDSQTVELTGWKAKHSELKQDYESLLQAYENISSKIAEMRQIIDLTRKEKQEAIQRFAEREREKQELEKQLYEAVDETEAIKNKLQQLAKSKQSAIDELQSKLERQTFEHEARMEELQQRLHEFILQNRQLVEENEQMKQTSENLKQALEKIQYENEVPHNEISATKSDLQVQMELNEADMQSKITDALRERESLLRQVSLLNDDISGKELNMLALAQERSLLSEKVKETEESLEQKNRSLSKLENACGNLKQEIVILNERVKILEDDKCLLQEELENVQETSSRVKNEREFLETELLNHTKKVDQLTDRLKSAQVQNTFLLQQLEELKAKNCSLIREQEEQQLNIAKVFEEKVKCAQRGNDGAKTKTRELQELLKEKQQEINQLQKDSIKFQELILDLERSVKLSQSKNDEFEKDLNNATEERAKLNEQIYHLNDELSSQKNLLDQSKSDLDRVSAENLIWKREVQKKEDQLQNQRQEYEKELELSLQQLKTVHKREWLNLEEKYNALQREKDKVDGEFHRLQKKVYVTDFLFRKVQAGFNATIAKLSAFVNCTASLPNDWGQIIQNKEKQVVESYPEIESLQSDTKEKMDPIQELKTTFSVLEESKNEVYSRQKSLDPQNYNELCRIKKENEILLNQQQKLDTVLQSKEAALHALLKENNSLNHLLENSRDAGRQIKVLENSFARKEQELQQILLEKEKIQAELEKQIAISQQMKIRLNNKDTEISLLVSSKDGEISAYLTQIQTQHRKQINEYEQQLNSLQIKAQQSEEACQKMENELKNLQLKADKTAQDKNEIANEIDALRKSMSSLQNDRDVLFSKYKDLEYQHENILSQRDGLFTSIGNCDSDLKQEIRKHLNRIDDLHSENAKLSAQLIKCREDFNQVLSLKDHQLKELLKQKLDCMKDFEQEKSKLQKQITEMQLTNNLQQESTKSLEHENQILICKINELESLVASLNKEKLVSETREKHQMRESDQKIELAVNAQHGEKLQDIFKKIQKLGKFTKSSEGKDSKSVLTSEWGNETDTSPEKRLVDLQCQNKQLRSHTESFAKAMASLQDDRDRLIEDFKILQNKYESELKTEKKRGDELVTKLNDFTLQIMNVLKEDDILSQELRTAKNKVTLDQVISEIENLCEEVSSQDLEISTLTSENKKHIQQIEAFSKAMSCLQDERDRLLQELSKLKAKEGTSLATVEMSKLKNKVDDLERALHQTKAFQAETEKEIASYKNELAGLRMEKKHLLTESQALQNQYQMAIREKDRQIVELQKSQQDAIIKESSSSNHPIKALEMATLVRSENTPEQVKQLLAERNQLQNELQHCLQEMQQKDVTFQQINSKVMQSTEENGALSAQLKTISQTLRDNQLCYTELQNRYFRLERDYRAMQVAPYQDAAQDKTRAEVPPGAPQERAAVIVELDNAELIELRIRLAETEQQYESVQQTLSQLTETLSEERKRREAAEEALGQSKSVEMSSYRSVPRDYPIQIESDEEREALIIDPDKQVVRKIKGRALSFRRWLRRRSLYCSKLLTSRAKSRYFFLTYFVTLHLVVFLCLTGIL
ncbi:PREDICTED: golgin subfamily B member 1-like [Gavialis gangeticus]|uniref:golgin subfamily B member 1-like n=1 Tax=Gavialis gangeticus TaxID=94835 RepID=UPI00092E56DC|nr:PREDICTED: golgin subfamily B member 1-like [Gavialis gangeticus]